MNIGTETPHKIQTFVMIYFQSQVERKYIHLEAEEDDKETCFYWPGFERKYFAGHKEKLNKYNHFHTGLVFLTTSYHIGKQEQSQLKIQHNRTRQCAGNFTHSSSNMN